MFTINDFINSKYRDALSSVARDLVWLAPEVGPLLSAGLTILDFAIPREEEIVDPWREVHNHLESLLSEIKEFIEKHDLKRDFLDEISATSLWLADIQQFFLGLDKATRINEITKLNGLLSHTRTRAQVIEHLVLREVNSEDFVVKKEGFDNTQAYGRTLWRFVGLQYAVCLYLKLLKQDIDFQVFLYSVDPTQKVMSGTYEEMYNFATINAKRITRIAKNIAESRKNSVSSIARSSTIKFSFKLNFFRKLGNYYQSQALARTSDAPRNGLFAYGFMEEWTFLEIIDRFSPSQKTFTILSSLPEGGQFNKIAHKVDVNTAFFNKELISDLELPVDLVIGRDLNPSTYLPGSASPSFKVLQNCLPHIRGTANWQGSYFTDYALSADRDPENLANETFCILDDLWQNTWGRWDWEVRNAKSVYDNYMSMMDKRFEAEFPEGTSKLLETTQDWLTFVNKWKGSGIPQQPKNTMQIEWSSIKAPKDSIWNKEDPRRIITEKDSDSGSITKTNKLVEVRYAVAFVNGNAGITEKTWTPWLNLNDSDGKCPQLVKMPSESLELITAIRIYRQFRVEDIEQELLEEPVHIIIPQKQERYIEEREKQIPAFAFTDQWIDNRYLRVNEIIRN